MASVERGAPADDCLKAAGGMYLRERQNMVESLCRLLQVVSDPDRFAPMDVRLKTMVSEFVSNEVLPGASGGATQFPVTDSTQTLVGQLVDILASPPPGAVQALQAANQSTSNTYTVQTPGGAMGTPGGGLVPAASANTADEPDLSTSIAALEFVTDERGRLCRKTDWLSHERKLVGECLFHAVSCVGPPADQSRIVSQNDAENLTKLFSDVAVPVLATAAADARARAAALDSGVQAAQWTQNGHVNALAARVGSVDALQELASSIADDLPCSIAVMFALATVMTPVGEGDESSKMSIASASSTVLGTAIKAAEDTHRRARDGDDADAARDAAARNPLRSAALGGGFGGLMFGRDQSRSTMDDANTEVAGMTVSVLEFVRFVKGLTVLGRGEAQGVSETAAKKEIVAASDAGALVALRFILATGTFRDDTDTSRASYLSVAHKTLLRAMSAALADADLGEALAAVSPAMTADQIAREERHVANAEVGGSNNGFISNADHSNQIRFDSYGNPVYDGEHGGHGTGIDPNDVHASEGERLAAMREEEDATRDAPLVATCKALAEVYRQAPELAKADVATNSSEVSNTARRFLDAIVEWEHGVESLSATLELLAAIAESGGEHGKRDAFDRLKVPPQGAAVAWDHFLSAVVGYNKRFAYGDGEDDRNNGPYGQAVGRDRNARPDSFGNERSRDQNGDQGILREMPEADMLGMMAYLEVLSSVLSSSGTSSGSNADQMARVGWLEQRSQCSLLDLLLRLYSNPVPSRLKAQLLKCVSSIGVSSGDVSTANEVWQRMEQCAILQSEGGAGRDAGDAYGGDYNESHGQLRDMNNTYGGQLNRRPYHPYGNGNNDINNNRSYSTASVQRSRNSHNQFDNSQFETQNAKNQLSIPGADLAYEFSTSEAKSGSYPHAKAYMQLVNDLLTCCAESGVGPAMHAGRSSATQFRFIRDKVFGDLKRRRHKSQEERWWMARDAIVHFSIQLRVWRQAVERGEEGTEGALNVSERDTAGRNGPVDASTIHPMGNQSDPTSAPGHEIVMDFLTDGTVFRGVLAVLSIGAERLAAERSSPHGEALEATVRESLSLLSDVFGMDARVLEEAKRVASVQGGARAAQTLRASTIDVALLKDTSQCGTVLGYARYRFDPQIPLLSIKILAKMAERKENVLHFLPDEDVKNIIQGAALCLESAANVMNGVGSDFGVDEVFNGSGLNQESGYNNVQDAVTAAGAAVLDIILDALPKHAPNVAHALLGFDHKKDPARVRLNPFGENFNCLSVLLELLEATPASVVSSDMPAIPPPEAAARVLFELVADARTAPATLECVTDWPPGAPGGQQRLALLTADALAATPPSDPRRRAAAAHHRAWLIRIAAAAVDYASPDLQSSFPVDTVDDLPPLVAAITRAALSTESWHGNGSGFDADSMGNQSHVEKPRLVVLETLATTPVAPLPPLAAANAVLRDGDGGLSEDVAQTRHALGIDQLLSDRRPTHMGGVFEVTSRGDAVVSVYALGARLLQNSQGLTGGKQSQFNQTSNQGYQTDSHTRNSHKLAVQLAVRQARAFNASTEEHAAHAHLTNAWSELVRLIASRCLPRGGSDIYLKSDSVIEPNSTEDSSEILFALAEGVLARLAAEPKPNQTPGAQTVSTTDGGGDAWYNALDAPLGRLANTLLQCLRDGSGDGGGVGGRMRTSHTTYQSIDETDDSSSDFHKVSAALDAAIGGGGPGAGVTDVASAFVNDGHHLGVHSYRTPTPLPPSKCKALLRGLLQALRRGDERGYANGMSVSTNGLNLDAEARGATYAALLSFLQYAAPRRAHGRFPQSVLRIAEGNGGQVGDGVDTPVKDLGNDNPVIAEARLAAKRASQRQDQLEAGIGALLRRDAVRLADLLGQDVVDPTVDDATRAVALAVVEALLTSVSQSGSSVHTGTYAKAAPAAMFGSRQSQPGFADGLPVHTPGGVGTAFSDEKENAPDTVFSRAALEQRTPGGPAGFGAGNQNSQAYGTVHNSHESHVTDPATSALVRALAASGVIKHCLTQVENLQLSDVILPTTAAAARLASTRAALGVLLRLAQLPGGGAKALCESGAMHALTNCGAVDAYAHDSPGDAAAAQAATQARSAGTIDAGHSARGLLLGNDDDGMMDDDVMGHTGNAGLNPGHHSGSTMDPALAAAIAASSPLAPPPVARQRHHALLVPVLRLTGVLINALAKDHGVRLSGVQFVRNHSSVVHRVLADRSQKAHLCDIAELEAAVVLVARLAVESSAGAARGSMRGTPTDNTSASAHEFIPALDSLTCQLIRGDGKYDAFIAVGSGENSPVAHTSHGKVTRRVAESVAGGRTVAVGGLPVPVAAAAAAKMERILRSIRATLVSAQLSLAEQGKAVFQAVESPGEDFAASPRPTIAAFARLAFRCAEEMREELKLRRVELRKLSLDGGVAAAAAASLDARGAGGAASAEAAAAASAAGAGTFSSSLGLAHGDRHHGSLLQGTGGGLDGNVTRFAALAAAAVGARERGVRVLAVTVEACLELVLGRVLSSRLTNTPAPAYAAEDVSTLLHMLSPVVSLLAEIDATECLYEFPADCTHGEPAAVPDTYGFCGGVCDDGGRLRSLVRRARDALLAAAPARSVEQPSLLLGGFRDTGRYR